MIPLQNGLTISNKEWKSNKNKKNIKARMWRMPLLYINHEIKAL